MPCLALIWIVGHNEIADPPGAVDAWHLRPRIFFTRVGVPPFCAFLIGLA